MLPWLPRGEQRRCPHSCAVHETAVPKISSAPAGTTKESLQQKLNDEVPDTMAPGVTYIMHHLN